MPHQGQKLRIHKDCIFVRLDDKAVVLDHRRRTHFTPQNDSACIVLDLLSRNAGKDKGASFEDLRDQLVQTFQVTVPQAETDLNAFLDDLEGFGLIEDRPGSDHIPPDPYYPPRPPAPGASRGRIVAGGTVITLGYVITWYR